MIGGVQLSCAAQTRRSSLSRRGIRWRELLGPASTLPRGAREVRRFRDSPKWTSPPATRHNPSRRSAPPPAYSLAGMEDTYLEHPPRPVCTPWGSVAVAEVAGNYLRAEHAIEAM